MSIEYRSMNWSDIPTVHEIESRVFVVDGWSVETFWSEMAGVPVRRWHVVATDASQIVGYGGVAFLAPDCDIQTVAVLPSHRRRGIAHGIIERLLEHAQGQGASVCHLEVAVENKAAIELYEQFGFVEIDRRVDYYSKGADALIMRSDLSGTAASTELSAES